MKLNYPHVYSGHLYLYCLGINVLRSNIWETLTAIFGYLVEPTLSTRLELSAMICDMLRRLEIWILFINRSWSIKGSVGTPCFWAPTSCKAFRYFTFKFTGDCWGCPDNWRLCIFHFRSTASYDLIPRAKEKKRGGGEYTGAWSPNALEVKSTYILLFLYSSMSTAS